jgi:glutaredoxin
MLFLNKKKISIIVYTVPGCHLCDEAIGILNSFKDKYRLDIQVIDILSDPELIEKYQNDVPVVLFGEKELFRHRIEKAELDKILKKLK